MNEFELNQKLQYLSRYFDVEKLEIEISKDIDNERLGQKIIEYLKSDSRQMNRFLYTVIYNVLEEYLLINYFPEKNTIPKDDNIYSIIKGISYKSMQKDIENQTGLILPRLILPKFNFIVLSLLFLLPLFLFVIFAALNIELLLGIPYIIHWGIISFFIFIPFVVAYTLFPGFFNPNKFKNIETFEDFIEDTLFINRYIYFNSKNDNLRNQILWILEKSKLL